MSRKLIPLVAIMLGMLVQTTPAPLRAWALGSSGLIRVPLPATLTPLRPSVQADLDRDGAAESLVLENSRATIYSAGEPVWQSPVGWTVLQAIFADLNRDSLPEATLLVWRPFRPWPVDQWLPHGGRIAGFQDAAGYSCHMILVGWRDHQYAEAWAGSALAEPVRSFAVADLNADGLQELVTLDGSYADLRSAPARELKVWEWNGFGFSVVSVLRGAFIDLAIVRSDPDHILILVP
jgi:hypothetical protein